MFNNNIQLKLKFWRKVSAVFFGLFLCILLLEVSLRIGGFILLSIQEHRKVILAQKKGTYRILCLGESTTAGQYPSYLEENLNQRNIGIKFNGIDKGVMAVNTSFILAQLESNLDTYNPDMVITMMGLNDYDLRILYGSRHSGKTMAFVRTFEIYKLANSLWLNILAKVNGIDQFSSKKHEKAADFRNSQPYFTKSYLDKALELNPKESHEYFKLGSLYDELGEFSHAEECFKKAMELSPRYYLSYVELGRLYRKQGKFIQAESFFRRAIKLSTKNNYAYVQLGKLYSKQNKFVQAEAFFKRAIELNPKDSWVYFELGWCYRNQGSDKEEEAFKKAIELNPQYDSAYLELGWFYITHQKLLQAEKLFKKAIELCPEDSWAYGALSIVYSEMGKYDISQEYSKKANGIREKVYNPVTLDNYRKLKEALDRKGIRLVCVQYPMRSVISLKKIFLDQEGIIFVDNEKIFKEAIKKTGYKDYFIDMHEEDRGHCTEKGNRLLAKNIADVILKEVFNQYHAYETSIP